MADGRKVLGAEGEGAAVCFLRRRGYAILERNYRCALGEVDVVALDGRTLVFVEVKTRTQDGCGTPFEAVDRRKQRQIVRTAQHFICRHDLHDRDVRFDVVGVWRDGRRLACELIPNAFEL